MSTWMRARTGHVSRRKTMDALGPVVYAAQLADGTIKIGWTEHFGDRLRSLKSHTGQDVELLAFKPGTFDDEQAIHAGLVEHRVDITVQAREYYRPSVEVLEVVNAMRAGLGMPDIA